MLNVIRLVIPEFTWNILYVCEVRTVSHAGRVICTTVVENDYGPPENIIRPS